MDLRPITLDDAAELCALANHCKLYDGSQQVLSVDELIEEMHGDDIDLPGGSMAAVVGGRMVGFTYLYHLPSEVRLERCYLEGDVDPAHRRQGIGSALLAWAVPRATEVLRSSGNSLPKYIRADHYDFVESFHRLYARHGFTPVRCMEELLRPLDDLPVLVDVEGLAIMPWPDDRDEDIRNEKNTSFADHWGSTPTTATSWHDQVRGFGGRPDLSFIAVDATGRVVAHLLSKRFEADDALSGRRDVWVDSLGTLAEWRGRGVGSALVARALHAYAAAGMTHATIGVDSENPTGASRLYRTLGFELMHRSITHEIEVTPIA